MSELHLSTDAEAELDDIWIHMARESGSIDIATRHRILLAVESASIYTVSDEGLLLGGHM